MDSNTPDESESTKENVTPTGRAPICEFDSEVINGIIPFCISNAGEAVIDTARAFGMDEDEGTYYSDWNMHLFVSFNNNKNDNDPKWQKFTRSLWPHQAGHRFFIKVPFYFQSYFVEVKLQLQHKERLNYLSPFSIEHKVKIPSFLVEPKLKVDDKIQYRVKNATFVRSAKIVEILENDESGFEYKIENIHYYSGDETLQTHKVNRNDIYQDAKYLDYLIDTCSLLDEKGMNTYRENAECDLVLKTRNKKLRNYYWTLRNIIAKLIPVTFTCENDAKAAYIYNFEYIGGLLSEIITNYLGFEAIICGGDDEKDQDKDKNKDTDKDTDSIKSITNVNYKVRCFINSSHMHASRTEDGFDIGFMYMENQWKHEISNCVWAIKHEHEIVSVQSFRCSGWSCDLCRCTINMNDWMYHCIPKESIACDTEGNCYCLQCVYGMANGIVAFENSLEKIVHKYIDPNFTMDCIREIVAFTVGNAWIQVS